MVNRFDLAHHFPELRKDADGSIVFGVMAVARRARSRGSVTLQPADPSTPQHLLTAGAMSSDSAAGMY
ncbi:hypothetical protein ACTMTI_21090 [Nonomuraea sp. H19]|uniref:hypothetical protein n=1 Tax=Nonomuraea sp. H19 TaxID=3452206 RepID=UPI003F8B3A5B